MVRLERETSSSQFKLEPELNNTKSHARLVVSLSIPLAIVLAMFVYEAYQRPNKPYYNLPSYADDATLEKAALASERWVPLIDLCYATLALATVWSMIGGYFLIFRRLQHAIVQHYLRYGQSHTGNLVYQPDQTTWSCWNCGYQYYAMCNYPHPNADSVGRQTLIRKRVAILRPYTQERVPLLVLPKYERSGQGKEDLECANILAQKSQTRDIVLGAVCFGWTLICLLVAVYILRQMSILEDASAAFAETSIYDNVHFGWSVFWWFVALGVTGAGMGGPTLSWLYHRWWLLHQGSLSAGNLSVHGIQQKT